MPNALLDSGPVIALINRSDAYHDRAMSCFQDFRGRLWSTASVVTEIAYVLAPSVRHQMAALAWLQRGVDASMLHIEGVGDLNRIATLLGKYSDLPADYADLSLVALGQGHRIDRVLTVDERDFAIYRSHTGKPFKNLFL